MSSFHSETTTGPRVAHTGSLARMYRAFRPPPVARDRRWLAIFVVLIGLNAAFHGKLINDFNIPGSDVQKATDLINAKFGGQKGAALRVVVAAPPGQRLDTPARAGGDPADARAPGRRRSTRSTDARRTSADHRPAGRGARTSSRRTAGSRSSTCSTTRRVQAPARRHRRRRGQDAVDRRQGRHRRPVHRRGRERAADAGPVRHHRPDRRVHHPDDPVPGARPDRRSRCSSPSRRWPGRSCCCTWPPG